MEGKISASSQSSCVKRERVRYCHANPLFDAWLQEWQEQAKQADSKMRFIFARARKSLSLFPLPVYSGSDCKVLQHFGDKICSMLDKKIEKHEAEHGAIDWDMHIKVERSRGKTSRAAIKSSTALSSAHPLSNISGAKKKVAAIERDVCGAHVETSNPSLSPPPHTLPTHVKRRRASSKAGPHKVARTNTNTDVSTKAITSMELHAEMERAEQIDTATGDSTGNISDDSILFTLPAGSYDVVLCVDCAETTSKSGREGIVRELRQNGVLHDVRKLHVGDFAWVARERDVGSGKAPRQLILPYLVERKRLDDLASSITDGRCREQKHRLLQSGIDTLIYLVEEAGARHLSLPLTTLHQAVANTSVIDGLLVKWTADARESAAYLTLVTRTVQVSYQGASLQALSSQRLPTPCPPGCRLLLPFAVFNASLAKNRRLTVREMMAKHLLQLSGLSVSKVAAIVEEVGTPSQLVELLRDAEGVARVAGMRGSSRARPVGRAAAEALAALYGSRVLR